MNELTIYSRIEETIERIKNKDDIEDVISNNLYKLPLYHDFIEMMALFNKAYHTCLVASGGESDER